MLALTAPVVLSVFEMKHDLRSRVKIFGWNDKLTSFSRVKRMSVQNNVCKINYTIYDDQHSW